LKSQGCTAGREALWNPRPLSENDLSGNALPGLDMAKSGGYMPGQAGFAGRVGV
jgi:hypothetical protein